MSKGYTREEAKKLMREGQNIGHESWANEPDQYMFYDNLACQYINSVGFTKVVENLSHEDGYIIHPSSRYHKKEEPILKNYAPPSQRPISRLEFLSGMALQALIQKDAKMTKEEKVDQAIEYGRLMIKKLR